MKLSKFTFIIIAIVSLLLIGNNGVAGEWKPKMKFLKIGTGSSGGVWYPQGAIIADEINKTLAPLSASVTPGGAVSNIAKLERNDLQMAMTYTNLEGLAWQGKGPFEKPHRNIRHLVSTMVYPFNMVVRADSGITKIEQLKDKKIIPGQKGFVSEWFARKVLEAHGLTYEQITKNGGLISYLSYKEGAALLQDKHAHCFALMAPHPSSLLMGLSTQTKIKLLPIEENMLKKIMGKIKGLAQVTVPNKPETYDVGRVVPALGAVMVYLVREDMSEELAYRITKIIYDKMPEMAASVVKQLATVKVEGLDRAAAAPLHPGAERYLREHRR
ncbi:MAG: TAXI family TRAP transporter solute-binding subunit [Candidatus Hodarchaeota archaeon]